MEVRQRKSAYVIHTSNFAECFSVRLELTISEATGHVTAGIKATLTRLCSSCRTRTATLLKDGTLTE